MGVVFYPNSNCGQLGTASLLSPKNSSQDCFLNGSTVLKKIKNNNVLHFQHSPCLVGVVFYPNSNCGQLGTASLLSPKNSSQDCFLNGSTVLKEIIIIYYKSQKQAVSGIFFFFYKIDKFAKICYHNKEFMWTNSNIKYFDIK